MTRSLPSLLVCATLLTAAPNPMRAQASAELDALWERVARSVRTGDPELYLSTYHPDAIFVSARRGISRTVAADVEANREAWQATADGLAERDLEFRFTWRIHDESSAHEVGLFRYSSLENGERTVATIHFSAALVKVDGEWLQLLEYQDSDATEAEWRAAGAGVEPEPTSTRYDDLIRLFEDFRAVRAPAMWSAAFDDPNAPYGVTDYGPVAVARRLAEVDAVERRLRAIDPSGWTVAQRADYLAVKAQIAAHRFYLEVSRPWARDPGTYVDPLLRLAFSDMGGSEESIARSRARLEAVPAIIDAAQANLTDGAADYLELARFNMRNPDGVGHGHPYRAVPPAGVVGWYEDLRGRAVESRPDMVPVVDRALEAVREFADWLDAAVPRMTARAGVGEARFDWYMRYAKLLPWTADEMALLARRDWERMMGFLALEEARNRDEPALEPAASAEEYQARLRRTDENVRTWLVEKEILTLPEDTPDFFAFGYNAPFIERPGGLNFWEKVQFRDPHPDHLHAVIPGHRYDGWFARRSDHPIRSRITDGVRVEGWGVYLEEPMVRAGVIDHLPRVHELMYLFGIFRATRVTADIGMQLNEMTITEGAAHMLEGSPWLDDDVARVDAEIYLRRPPGYGLGYTIGNLQLQQLLGEVRSRDGDDFDLRAFHDDFLAKGRIPISLIRYEMLGTEDQVADFWVFEPIPPGR